MSNHRPSPKKVPILTGSIIGFLSRRYQIFRVVAGSAAVLLAGHFAEKAQAATRTWTGGAPSDDNWTTGANWGGTAAASGDTLLFGGTVRLGPVNDLTADASIAGITFNSGAGAFTLSGNRITLTSNVTNSSSTLQTINLDMIMGATRTFSTNSGSMAVGGILSGAGGLIKNQPNTLTLTGANTYTGSTTLQGGILLVSGVNGTIKDSSSVIVNVGLNVSGQTSAVLRLDNTAGNVDRIGDTKSVTLTNEGELALVGNTTASTTETIGSLVIGLGARSASGIITLSGTAGGLLTTLAAADFTRVNYSTGLIRGTSLGQQATNATRLTLTSTAGLSFVGTTTASGTTPGSAKDVKIVPYLRGDTSATGGGSGFVTYDAIGGLRPLGASEYTTLTAGYTAPVSKENVIAFNGTLTAANPTVNSLLFNTSGQSLNGSGVLTVQSGAIAAVVNSASIGSGFSSITLGNGTWNEGVITASINNTFTINSPIAVTGGAAGVLTKGGAGSVNLAAASSYDATTYVVNGNLRVLHDRALGSTVGGTIVNGEAGARFYLGNSTTNVSLAEPLTLLSEGPSFASALYVDGGQQTITGAISVPTGTRINVANGSLTITGGVTGSNVQWTDNVGTNGTLIIKTTAFNLGAGTFYKDSPGLTVLNVAGNSWNTTTLASTGTLRLGVAGALPSTTLLQLGVGYATPANLDLNGFAQTVNGLRNATTSGTASTRVVFSANAATLTLSSSTDYGFDGNFFGALGLIKNGANTQTFSGTGLHSGDTVVNVGTLAVANTGLLQNSTLDTGASGTQQVTFTVSGTNTYSLGGLKGADALAIGANSLNIGLNNQSTSFTGAITGTTGGLTKIGTGALTLGGSNTFTGATVLNSGGLILDFTASNSSKLSDTASLTLGSATLQLDRAAAATGSHTEIVLSTSINGGATITRGTGSTAVLQMNALTRSAGGTLNLGAASIASTDTNNINGVLGPWATINGTDWASSVASGAADTLITAFSGYTDIQRLTPGTIADGSTTNVRLVEGSGSAGNIALGSTTTTINTLNQSTSGGGSAATIDAASKTLAVNGILVGSGAGSLTLGATAGSGTLTAATAGGELILQHYGSNALTINSVIANNTSASGLTQSGTGTTVLAGVNVYTGKTIINGGKLSIAAKTALGSNPGSFTADQLTLNGGTLLTTATLALDDSNRGITLGAAGGTFEVSTGTTTIAATSLIAGSGGLTKTGAGTLTLSGTANTYTGPTTISAGVLSVSSLGNGGANSALGAASRANFNLIFDGGTLQYTGASSSTSDRFFTINNGKTATIEVQAAAFGNTPTLTLGGGAGASTGALTKTGLGTLSLTGGSDYDGATTVSTGTLLIGADYALGSTVGSTTVAGGAMLQLQNSITVPEAISITGQGTGNSGSLRSDSGVNTLTGLLTITGSGGTRIRADGGSLTLSGGVSRPGALSTDAFLMVVNNSAFLAVDTNPINVGVGRIEMVGAAGAQNRLAVTGNTYGLLQVAWTSNTRLDVVNALNASAILEIGTGGTGAGASAQTGNLDLYGNSQTVAELRTGSGTLVNANLGTRTIGSVEPATLTVNQSTTSIYDGTFTGALALTKSGPGTLTLSGASTNTGATIISGGTVIISGSLSGTSTVSVAGSATLASGSTGGSITPGATSGTALDVSGTLSPGGTALAPITLTLAGTATLNFNDGSQLRLDVGAANSSDTVAFGTAGDWLRSSGSVTLALNGTVDYASTYTVFSNVTTDGFTFANITGYDTANWTANFFDAGTSYQVNFVAIPEPGTAANLLGALGMLVGLRRLRRRR